MHNYPVAAVNGSWDDPAIMEGIPDGVRFSALAVADVGKM